MRTAFSVNDNRPNDCALSLTPGFSPVCDAPDNKNRFNGFSTLTQFPLASQLIGLVAGLLLMAFSASAQQPATNNVRFLAVDIFVDSKGKPLAAYQLEFSSTNGATKIVGIEGGGHPAFREAPHYDPKAIQAERVIIAAFSTSPAKQLPSGRVRVATIHLQINEGANPAFASHVQIVADERGDLISGETDFQFRRIK